MATAHEQGGATFAVGLDIGTSAVKGAVLTADGEEFSYVSAGYPTRSPRDGWAEQDPDDWWHAVGDVVDAILDAHPGLHAGNTIVGLTGQMHTTVLRDAEGVLLRPAILWSDTRAADAVARLRAETDAWLEVSGYTPIPAFTSAHLRWVREHEPEVFAAVRRVAVPKDDIRMRLGAGWATEPSDASAMNLLDTRTDEWSSELLAAVGIGTDVLPPIVPSDAVTGRIAVVPGRRPDTGRLVGAPVIAGGADQAAQAYALGATGGGRVAVSVGTSGAALQAIDAPRAGAFRHCVPDTWLALDSTHAAGLALAWWSGISGQTLDERSVVTDGHGELPMFLPYLQGGRTGHGAPGTLTDLRPSHRADDIRRAVVEGVAIELVRLVRSATDDVLPADPIGVGGRAARDPELQAVLATALERRIFHSERGPAHGVASLAASISGESDRRGRAGTGRFTDPDPHAAPTLTARIDRYADLVGRLS